MIKPCPKTVKRNKYEKLAVSNRIWWKNNIEELEAKIQIPAHTKLTQLQEVFTNAEIKALRPVGLKYCNDKEENVKVFGRQRKTSKKLGFQSMVFMPVRTIQPYSEKQNRVVDRLHEFFTKPKEEVNIWSPKVKLLPKLLVERAEIMEEEIAEKFSNWLQSFSPSEINKSMILDLFKSKNTLPISTSIAVNMQILETVPNRIANYLGEPELGGGVAVQLHMKRDYEALKIEPHNIAFNQSLPADLRQTSLNKDTQLRWFSYEKEHKELETFEAVFKDIMHLETSKRYVLWLRNCTNIVPPPYLRKAYMAAKMKQTMKSCLRKPLSVAKVVRPFRTRFTLDDNKQDNLMSKSVSNESLATNFIL